VTLAGNGIDINSPSTPPQVVKCITLARRHVVLCCREGYSALQVLLHMFRLLDQRVTEGAPARIWLALR
jgi:hypothetical protein